MTDMIGRTKGGERIQIRVDEQGRIILSTWYARFWDWLRQKVTCDG